MASRAAVAPPRLMPRPRRELAPTHRRRSGAVTTAARASSATTTPRSTAALRGRLADARAGRPAAFGGFAGWRNGYARTVANAPGG